MLFRVILHLHGHIDEQRSLEQFWYLSPPSTSCPYIIALTIPHPRVSFNIPQIYDSPVDIYILALCGHICLLLSLACHGFSAPNPDPSIR